MYLAVVPEVVVPMLKMFQFPLLLFVLAFILHTALFHAFVVFCCLLSFFFVRAPGQQANFEGAFLIDG